LGGLGSMHFDRRTIHRFKTITSMFSTHYPETAYKMYIINAPMMFTALWKMVKVFLHPITAAKIDVVGSNWKPVLHKNGVRLFNPEGKKVVDSLKTYHSLLAQLAADFDLAVLAKGYMPEAEAEALAHP
jgi:hypothetical protein